MDSYHQNASDVIKARLTLDVTYLLSGEPASEVLDRLREMCERAIGEGLLTGSTSAEVESWAIDVSMPAHPRPDSENAALEAGIAAYLRQRIEDGHLDAEDIPARLARYGLMDSETFVAEMRERMAMAAGDEAPGPARVTAPDDPDDSREIEMRIAIACVNASGTSDLPIFTVKATQEEYDLGIHYDKAETLAEEAGYEKPFVCFDAAQQHAITTCAIALGAAQFTRPSQPVKPPGDSLASLHGTRAEGFGS
ncbi:MAG: hypothetical protein FWG56_02220 [Desulfovibrionaceae bacterium]|nr:hypothetical protein [Desulfovibrionaceae bacterium]